MRSSVKWALGIGVLVSVVALATAHWLPFISDDAFISLRYAQRASQGLGLTWSEGERTEGYTDLLWVLLNVPSFWLNIDPVVWLRGLGLFGLALAIGAVLIPTTGREFSTGRFLGSLLLATSAPLTVWAIGGLEQTFVAGLLVVALISIRQSKPRLAGLALGLLVLTRADGPVLVACISGPLFFIERRSLAGVLTTPVVAWVTQTLIRLSYYGEWVPNTARAKVAFSLARIELGAHYVSQALLESIILVVLGLFAITALIASRERRRFGLILLCVSVGWSLYVATVGGDIFPASRQLVPALAVLGLAVAEAAQGLDRRLLVVLAALVPVHVGLQLRAPENVRATAERWEWDALPLGTALQHASRGLPRKPVLAVDPAGALPFWAELPTIDMLGLNDKWLAHHPPADFGRGPLAHELGSGDYVFDRGPDLIAFCLPAARRSPCFRGGYELVRHVGFEQRYRVARISAGEVIGEFWVRHDEGPLATQIGDQTIEIPVWQLATEAPALITESPHGSFETPVAITSLSLPVGSWAVSEPGAFVSWRCGNTSASQVGTGTAFSGSQVQLVVDLGHPITHLTLQRVADEATGFRCTSGEISRDATSLATPLAPHTAWNDPHALVFGAAGARITFSTPRTGPMEVSVDNNDQYVFTFFDGTAEVGVRIVEPSNQGPGLSIAKLETPPRFDSFRVTAKGDGAFSIGHVK